MKLRVEDTFEDVLAKAARGLGLGASEIADRAGIPAARVRDLLRGNGQVESLRRIAPVLDLDAEALVDLAVHRVLPGPQAVAGLAAFTEPYPVPGYEEMTVHSYLVWDAATAEAVVFDAGVTGRPLLEVLEARGLSLKAVFLTHSHADHVAGLEALLAGAGNPPVYLHRNESIAGARPFAEGHTFVFGQFRIETRLTAGHSPGGCTYVVSGLERPLAIVGDSLFSLSQGGAAAASYAQALRNNREKILSLPEDTVLCPGHGPMTTVAFEKAHNPFFARSGD